MKISVIVTNWNGLKLLQRNLVQVIKMSDIAEEIIIADDAPTDESLKYVSEIQKKYPQLKIISHKENLGFSKNSNDAVTKSRGNFVVLLNSDIFPYPDYLKPSIQHLDNSKLLGVGFAEAKHENYAKLFWKNGYIQHCPEYSAGFHISGWLSGGSSIFNKQLFLHLGGFDHVYAPFYSEDLDLGYRAWKSGLSCLWEPKSKVEHHHESTTSKFSRHLLDYVKERNRLISVWRNITDPKMLSQNKWAIFWRCISGPNYLKIIRAANSQIKKFPPPIVFPVKTDSEIFSLFK